MNKAQAGSFIGRIQNYVNPNTGSAPILGISSQSIINSVRMGQMQDFSKRDGGVVLQNNGCPCVPLALSACNTN
jgi:hypothetical protein